jgi:hypothetical protein
VIIYMRFGAVKLALVFEVGYKIQMLMFLSTITPCSGISNLATHARIMHGLYVGFNSYHVAC